MELYEVVLSKMVGPEVLKQNDIRALNIFVIGNVVHSDMPLLNM